MPDAGCVAGNRHFNALTPWRWRAAGGGAMTPTWPGDAALVAALLRGEAHAVQALVDQYGTGDLLGDDRQGVPARRLPRISPRRAHATLLANRPAGFRPEPQFRHRQIRGERGQPGAERRGNSRTSRAGLAVGERRKDP